LFEADLTLICVVTLEIWVYTVSRVRSDCRRGVVWQLVETSMTTRCRSVLRTNMTVDEVWFGNWWKRL
jgi:hypothetical protein